MTWDSVPWFVGGGAQHSTEVARLLAYAALNGNEGVMAPPDLKVTALATPGGSVDIAPGACAILCRATGEAYQMYGGRLPSQDTATIAPTDASGPRSDLVIVRVEDPNLAGEPWSIPADPTVGPYIFTRVISNVPSTTTSVEDLALGYTAIALARIDVPVSTSAITDAMIVDLRNVANPRRDEEQFTLYPASTNSLTSATFVTWPASASWTVDVPSWAVKAIVTAIWGQAQAVDIATGSVRVNLGGQSTQVSGWQKSDTGSARQSVVAAGSIAVPGAMRGTAQTITLEGKRNTGTGHIEADTGSAVILSVTFLERAA